MLIRIARSEGREERKGRGKLETKWWKKVCEKQLSSMVGNRQKEGEDGSCGR